MMISVPALQQYPDSYVLNFRAKEGLSQVATYRLDFVSRSADLDLESLISKEIEIRLSFPGQAQDRRYSAYVTGFSDRGQREGNFAYQLELSSWLWFLDRTADCRIFQLKNVQEIVETVISSYPGFKFSFDLQADYQEREYCVQYKETDLNFISRLLEEEGIYYRASHVDGAHSIVFTDVESWAEEQGSDELFTPDVEENRSIKGRAGVQRLDTVTSIMPPVVSLNDYDYKVPGKELYSAHVNDSVSNLPTEWHQYSANYRTESKGEDYARFIHLSLQVQARRLSGKGNTPRLHPGSTMTLALHDDTAKNRRYGILATEYHFIQDEPDGSGKMGDLVFVDFSVVPDEIPFKAPRIHAKTSARGLQSAVVVGVPKADVHTDDLARVRVHFHWDRYTTDEHDSSCWIRVVQAWNGKGWGSLSLPRVGTEVMITHVDEDIDRPLVIGQVYNSDYMPPYDLPSDIRYSGIVSRSHKQGEPAHASQLTFDDRRNRERLMLHAERDLQQEIERNDELYVVNNSFEKVDNTKTRTITNEVEVEENKDTTTTNTVSAKAVSTSFTGNSVSATGVSTSLTGVSTSFTGVSTSSTGVSSSATGVSTSSKGVSNSATGISNRITGSSSSVTGVSNSMTGVSNSMTGVSTSATGVRNSVVGISNSMTGVSTSATGVSNSVTGVFAGVTGVSTVATGVTTGATGVSVSTTGVSTSATGMSVSATGLSVSFTGASFSFTGVKISHVGQSITL